MVRTKKQSSVKDGLKITKKLKMLKDAQEYGEQQEEMLETAAQNWENRFGNRASFVIENVSKVLGAVVATTTAGKNPLDLVKGRQEILVDLLAGAKALMAAGAGASTALHSFYQEVLSDREGLTPEQAELEAVKYAGRSSPAAKSQVKQTLDQLTKAIATHDQQEIEDAKSEFGKISNFYQKLSARTIGKK